MDGCLLVRSFIAQLLRYARLFEAGGNQRFEECESDIDRGETAGKSEKGPKKKEERKKGKVKRKKKKKRKVEEKRKGDKS